MSTGQETGRKQNFIHINMKKVVRNWKILVKEADTIKALQALREQKFLNGHLPVDGPIAIQSQTSRKMFDEWEPSLQLRADETIGTWFILVPDNEKERQKNKIIELAKESNATGLKYDKLEHMSIEEIWEYITDHFDDDIKYKMLKLYFENKVYSKNQAASKDKKKGPHNFQGEDTGFVDAFGDPIYEGDIFVYKKYLPFKDPSGRPFVPDDIISNWAHYKPVVCLHPVFFDDDKQCWASDVYGDADPLSSYDANQIVVVTNIADHQELYNH